MMDVGIICEYFPDSAAREMRGGVEARTYFIARHLAKKHDVTVYSINEEGFSQETSFEGLNVKRVGPKVTYSQSSSLAKRAVYMRAAAKAAKEAGHDLVDGTSVMGYAPAWWSNACARVITYHDVWVGKWIRNFGVKGVFGEALERYVLSRDWDHIIAVSGYTKDNLLRNGIPHEKVTVAPNGIDVEEYLQVSSPKNVEPTISCVARLVGYKRVKDLLEAAAKVREQVPDLKVKVVGTGPERERLSERARCLGVSDAVDFMGYVKEHRKVLETIKSSHVFCLPSAVEGYGITVVEAIALGVPYVAADIPAVREATRGGTGGRLYPVGDVKALTHALVDALDQKITGGVESIDEYDWSRSAEVVESVYESVK